jgi:hypothetical protein
VGHKSPTQKKRKTLVEPDLGMKKIPNKHRTSKSHGDLQNLYDTDDVMSDDAKSCLSITDDNGLSHAGFDDAFRFPNRQSAPVELGKCSVICTAFKNVLYEDEPSDNCLRLRNQTYFSMLSLHPLPLGTHPTTHL